MSRAIPDRWTKYSPYGSKVADTRFVAFKVPLSSRVNERVEENVRLDAERLLNAIPNLGLVIDLTNTDRYYNPVCFKKKGIQHRKLNTPGHVTPPKHLVQMFKRYVNEYLRDNKNNDKLIGVHCTHGVNRTGFFICNYMISEMTMSPEDAIKKFSDARGYSIERQNYLKALKNLNSEISDLKKSIERKDRSPEYAMRARRSSLMNRKGPSRIENGRSDHQNDNPRELNRGYESRTNLPTNLHPLPIRNEGLINFEQRWNSVDVQKRPSHPRRHHMQNERRPQSRHDSNQSWSSSSNRHERDGARDHSVSRGRRGRYSPLVRSTEHSTNWRDRPYDGGNSGISNWRSRPNDHATTRGRVQDHLIQ